MSNYQFINVDSSITTTNQWLDLFASHYGYRNDYMQTLQCSELYPLDMSDAMLTFVNYLNNGHDKKIFIFGDYDCDGICATTIMHLLLNHLNIQHGYYIPNRFSEGYGLNIQRIDQAYEKGYTTIFTVDNGVVAYKAIEHAKRLGMDVLISDHHTIDQMLDVPLLHPDLMEDNFAGLCGSGLVYELSRHFMENPLLDTLAMIATIGDMMVLEKENRRIVKHGLRQLNTYGFGSIKALIERSNVIDESTIAFQVVPKINALGRLPQCNPNNLIKYLVIEDLPTAWPIAQQIIQFNQQRKDVVPKINALGRLPQCNPNNLIKYLVIEDLPTAWPIAQQIIQFNQQRKDLVANCVEEIQLLVNETIVVALTDASSGIVGLIAAALVNKYNKPALVFTLDDTTYVGSGRSVSGFNFHQALVNLNFTHFVRFGGHSGALGCSIAKENFNEFIDRIKTNNINWQVSEPYTFVFNIDQNQINNALMDALISLKPFDKTHPMPLFSIDNREIIHTQLLKNVYPKLNLSNGVDVISFKIQSLAQLLQSKWIVELGENNFRGNVTIQARVFDVF